MIPDTVVVQLDEGGKAEHKQLYHNGKWTLGPWVAAKHIFEQNIYILLSCEFVIVKFQVKKRNFLWSSTVQT